MKKHFLLFLSILFFNTIILNAQKKNEDINIPPSFANFKGVLLIEKFTRGDGNATAYTKRINQLNENKFSKIYKGEFEFIDNDDLQSSSYKDAKKYQFIVQSAYVTTANGFDYCKFVITDKANGIKYESPFSNWLFPPSIIKVLEKTRAN